LPREKYQNPPKQQMIPPLLDKKLKKNAQDVGMQLMFLCNTLLFMTLGYIKKKCVKIKWGKWVF